jgi:hypothetical protein
VLFNFHNYGENWDTGKLNDLTRKQNSYKVVGFC